MENVDIEVFCVETMWITQGHEALNVRTEKQAQELIDAIRKLAKDMKWKVK